MGKIGKHRAVAIKRINSVDGLPEGWTMEVKVRKNGLRSDPLYKDPLTGYVFRSKKDALRYLETGDLGRHAFKPKDADTNAMEEIVRTALPSSGAKEKKAEEKKVKVIFGEGQCSNSDAAVNDVRILEPPSAGGEIRKNDSWPVAPLVTKRYYNFSSERLRMAINYLYHHNEHSTMGEMRSSQPSTSDTMGITPNVGTLSAPNQLSGNFEQPSGSVPDL